MKKKKSTIREDGKRLSTVEVNEMRANRKKIAKKIIEKRAEQDRRKQQLNLARSVKLHRSGKDFTNKEIFQSPTAEVSSSALSVTTRCSKQAPSMNVSATTTNKRGRKECVNTKKVSKSTDRVRKHREKMGAEGLAKKREADRLYNQKRKEQGLNKSISEISRRDAKEVRKKWRERSQRYRKNKQLRTTEEQPEHETENAASGSGAQPQNIESTSKSHSTIIFNKPKCTNKIVNCLLTSNQTLRAKLRRANMKIKSLTVQMER